MTWDLTWTFLKLLNFLPDFMLNLTWNLEHLFLDQSEGVTSPSWPWPNLTRQPVAGDVTAGPTANHKAPIRPVYLINRQYALNISVWAAASRPITNLISYQPPKWMWGWNRTTFILWMKASAGWSVSITWSLRCWPTNVISLREDKKKRWRRGWIMEFNRGEFAHCSGNSLVRLIITTSLSCLKPSFSLCFFCPH